MQIRFPLVFLLVCFALSAQAANIYQCHGKNGEIAFSNVPCDGKATAKVHSTYEPVKDEPLPIRTTDDVATQGILPAPASGGPLAQSPAQPYVPAQDSPSGYRNTLSTRYQARGGYGPGAPPRNSTGGYANDLSDAYSRKGH